MIVRETEEAFKIENLLGSRARIKILKVLALNQELSISQIIKITKLNHATVKSHLNYLKSYKLVQEKIFGRIKIYRYKIENIRAKSLKTFIQIWEGDL
ncbi:MAG: winged helix-turn-helix transcriptional regulator [Candidatus Lokiarchaeota archaeon]|nr:winged helix-turn-helix transcriptional regulator [Candidatus Lokiarchaeota archaeon]